MRLQLWSYNYDPEPSGIGPVSTTLAKALSDRGHEIDVVAAHPHYPEPRWGTRRLPYREERDGIPVLRLPLWVGRATSAERYRQELSFMAAQLAAAPFLSRPDVAIVVSPSFPALLPAIVAHRLRRTPWILWLHDILPDGATATGLVREGSALRAARALEQAAYRHAARIVVLSRAFTTNLEEKGISREKIRLIYDPATREPGASSIEAEQNAAPATVLSMGNIGFSQGLAPLVEAFEASQQLSAYRVQLVITGTGVAAPDVRSVAVSDRVSMLGMVSDAELEHQLRRAKIAFVSQLHDGAEFNIPSKLMNFMAYGLPVLAAVNPGGEVAHIVTEAQAGWVVDSSRPQQFPAKLAELLDRPDEIRAKGAASQRYAQTHFTVRGFADRFESVLSELAPASQRAVTTAETSSNTQR